MKPVYLIFLFLIIISLQTAAQNVGIGNSAPQARLHVTDSSVLFSGPSSLPATPGLPPLSGGGTRMMWYSNKAAFRVGQVFSTNWNETNIGLHSLAAGYNTRASGQYSTAFGNSALASGIGSFAFGNNTTASGQYATATGQNTTASSFGSLVAGRYNILSGSGSAWNETDPLFVVGNGYDIIEDGILTITRRNALLIKKNADAEISGNTTIKKSLTINDSLIAEGGAGITGNAVVSGKLGIGTLTPQAALDVNGTMVLRPKYILVTQSDQVFDIGTSSFLILSHGGANGLNWIRCKLSTAGAKTGQVVYIVRIDEPALTGGISIDGTGLGNVGCCSDLGLDAHTVVSFIYDGTRWCLIAYHHNT